MDARVAEMIEEGFLSDSNPHVTGTGRTPQQARDLCHAWAYMEECGTDVNAAAHDYYRYGRQPSDAARKNAAHSRARAASDLYNAAWHGDYAAARASA